MHAVVLVNVYSKVSLMSVGARKHACVHMVTPASAAYIGTGNSRGKDAESRNGKGIDCKQRKEECPLTAQRLPKNYFV